MLTLWTHSFINENNFDFFLGAVFLTALYGGLGPGLVASVLSILALDYFFIKPLYSLSCGVTDVLRLGIFGLVAALTSSLSARLRKMEAERAVVDISNQEQRRLGQDLHDGLCQMLAGIKLTVESIKTRSEEIELVESRLTEALAQADSIARGLYPVELEMNGLISALQELSEKLAKVYRAPCDFKFWGNAVSLDNVTATHLYRIAQEAVVNGFKRGKAKRIKVRLIYRKPAIILAVADDGVGFPSTRVRKGMGLQLMEGHANIIDAVLQIRARPQGGTLVSVALRRNGP